jgi:hypothetical protein
MTMLSLALTAVLGLPAALAPAPTPTPTPGVVIEPALKARVDADGNIAQVYATFTLSNPVARPKGTQHRISVTIDHMGTLARTQRASQVRWTATLLGAGGQDFTLGQRYRVTINACGSTRCAHRSFIETLQRSEQLPY